MIEDKSNISMKTIAIQNNLGCKTFYNYARPNKENRNQLGSQVGRKSLLSKENFNFFDQLLIRSGHGNEGMTPDDLIVTLKNLNQG